MTEENLTVQTSYKAMLIFLDKLYELTRSDDLAGLLGGLQLTADGRTMDPAAWSDWLEAVELAKAGSR